MSGVTFQVLLGAPASCLVGLCLRLALHDTIRFSSTFKIKASLHYFSCRLALYSRIKKQWQHKSQNILSCYYNLPKNTKCVGLYVQCTFMLNGLSKAKLNIIIVALY